MIKLKWLFNDDLILFLTLISVKKELKEKKINKSVKKFNKNSKIVWNHDTWYQNKKSEHEKSKESHWKIVKTKLDVL